MRTGTIVSLGASALLGLGALAVAKLWLPAGHGQGPKTAVASDTTPVVVARADIPYGAKLDASRLAVERLPLGTAPTGAFSDPAQLSAQPGGPPIALVPIAAREPVLAAKISGAGARPTVAAIIGEGMRGYAIGISDVAGDGGHVLPGDRVDVVLTRDLAAETGGGLKHLVCDVVLQNVRVLGVDLNADPTSTQAAVAHSATLEVSVQDAERLAVAAQSGTLSLALRRTGSAEMAPARTISISDLGPHGGAVIPVSHTRTARSRRAPSFIQTRAVTVVHGDSSTAVEVPAERFGAGA
jgi:pilus assembly protein CpaB